MGRKLKNASGQDKPPSRFKILCGTYRLNYEKGHLSMTEFAEKLGGYKQSTLSQIENRAEGPPVELVQNYADFFKLENEKRLDFFLAALEASNKIGINCTKISPICRDSLLKFRNYSVLWAIKNQRCDIVKLIWESQTNYPIEPCLNGLIGNN
jgi:transcriptional regulator with XRE-family HTH domain